MPGQRAREVVTDSDTDDEESEKYDSFPVQGEISGPPIAGAQKSNMKRQESLKKKNTKTGEPTITLCTSYCPNQQCSLYKDTGINVHVPWFIDSSYFMITS